MGAVPNAPLRKRETVRGLLDRHGQTFADELRINLSKPTPSPLFQLLCASVLYSARINSEIAGRAFGNFKQRGWRTAEKMAQSEWEDRVTALNEAGYAR